MDDKDRGKDDTNTNIETNSDVTANSSVPRNTSISTENVDTYKTSTSIENPLYTKSIFEVKKGLIIGVEYKL